METSGAAQSYVYVVCVCVCVCVCLGRAVSQCAVHTETQEPPCCQNGRPCSILKALLCIGGGALQPQDPAWAAQPSC